MRKDILDISGLKEILIDYILNTGKDMLHGPVPNIPHPFIVPGAAYSHDLWDWDCFFAAMAMLQILDVKEQRDNLDIDEKDRFIEHAKGNIMNFLDAQMQDGFIPIVLTANANEATSVLHANGCLTNMHKPCLAMNAAMISGYIEDFNWLEPYFDRFENYFRCYETYFHDPSGLFIWANDVMIGVDNDPATFGRPPKSSASIFLNSFMARELKSMALIAGKLGKETSIKKFTDQADEISKIVQEECWDQRDGIYYSVDVDCRTRRPNPNVPGYHMGLGVTWNTIPIKIQCWSSFLSMWAGVASVEQAERMVMKHIRNPETFNSEYGIRSLSRDEKMYSVIASSNPSNWLGPVWIVANYLIFRSLMKYGYTEDAFELGEKMIVLLGKDIEKNGALHEYYNPETGEGVMNKGFLNWNLLALNIVCEMDGQPTIERFIP